VGWPQLLQWLLHDPDHGYYGAGHVRFGPRGDFVTSPALGSAFAELLARQLLPLFERLAALGSGPLALIEWGPGDGDLAVQLRGALERLDPHWLGRLELVLQEASPALRRRQHQRLAAAGWPLAAGTAAPRRGVVLANELFDALPVERFRLGTDGWRRLQVTLDAGGRLQEVAGPPLAQALLRQLDALGLPADGGGRPLGWTSEWCPALAPYLRRMRRGLERGWLLAIDYALTARRLYAPWRDGGTLLAVRDQQAGADLLQNPGQQDLSAHVCLDAMALAAGRSGWHWHGSALQGEALLGLGLAGELSALSGDGAGSLASRLQRREELLRLVDPHLLGGFHWMLLQTEPAEALGDDQVRLWPGWSA
jgi:SAM-dependent MidA family methyltransferase